MPDRPQQQRRVLDSLELGQDEEHKNHPIINSMVVNSMLEYTGTCGSLLHSKWNGQGASDAS